ncbi:hypothetical protein NE237_021993 [Protea cynaroides]|uniref:Calmodulin-binding domain-containing protein n=1 Tax=Protea cynaroides TaxID=273540 RepID=A0A9Q0H9J6_9MAGN|nr:hypothetical protein NE237_021993 [Protea cynaroides]
MDEERIEILVTPKRTMLEDSNMRNSTGENSTSSSTRKIISRYLRASTGSCHDLCKYGRKQAFEDEPNHHFWRSFTTNVAIGKNSVNSAIVLERKKKAAMKLRPSLDSNTQSANNSEIIKQEDQSSSKKKEVSPKEAFASPKQALSPAKQIEVSPRRASVPANEIEVSPKQASAPAKQIEDSPRRASAPAKLIEFSPRQASTPAKKIGVSPKQALSPAEKIGVSRKQALLPAKQIEVSPRQASAPAKKIGVSPKQALPPTKKIEVSQKQVLLPAKKIEVSQKQTLSHATKIEVSRKQTLSHANKIVVSRKQALSPAKKIEVSPKQVLSPAKKLEGSTKQTVSPAKISNASIKPGIGGKRNSDCKILKKMGTSKIDEKKALSTPMASVSPKPSDSRVLSINTRKYRNVKAVSPLKSRNKVKKSEPKLSIPVEEKTLYVIEETESKSLEPAQNGSYTTKSSASSFSSSSSLSLDSSSLQSPPLPESTDCPPRKLKFKRGQVVVGLHSENSGPRRLRFRRGKVLGENDGKGDIGRKSLRRTEASLRKKEVTDGETDGTKSESEKVVLRHQDVQGKKDAQSLFNNVIEETASKLVETRKSKVKALVGAFETVISLQERKPSSG